MFNYKSIFSSVGVWGGIVAVVAGIFGYTVSDQDVTEVGTTLTSVVAAVGGLVAIWGRIRATKQVTVSGEAPKTTL